MFTITCRATVSLRPLACGRRGSPCTADRPIASPAAAPYALIQEQPYCSFLATPIARLASYAHTLEARPQSLSLVQPMACSVSGKRVTLTTGPKTSRLCAAHRGRDPQDHPLRPGHRHLRHRRLRCARRGAGGRAVAIARHLTGSGAQGPAQAAVTPDPAAGGTRSEPGLDADGGLMRPADSRRPALRGLRQAAEGGVLGAGAAGGQRRAVAPAHTHRPARAA